MAVTAEPAGQGGRPWDWDGFGPGRNSLEHCSWLRMVIEDDRDLWFSTAGPRTGSGPPQTPGQSVKYFHFLRMNFQEKHEMTSERLTLLQPRRTLLAGPAGRAETRDPEQHPPW